MSLISVCTAVPNYTLLQNILGYAAHPYMISLDTIGYHRIFQHYSNELVPNPKYLS